MSWLSRLVWIIEILLFLFFYQIFLNFIIKTWSNFNINFPENIFRNFHYTKHFRYHPHTYIKKCENQKPHTPLHTKSESFERPQSREEEKCKSRRRDPIFITSPSQTKVRPRVMFFFPGFLRVFPAAIFRPRFFPLAIRCEFFPRVSSTFVASRLYIFFFRCFFLPARNRYSWTFFNVDVSG